MGTTVVELVIVLLLVLVNAVFAGSEIALLSLREGQVRRLAGTGRRGRAVAAIARDPNRFLSTVQVGITSAGFLASAFAAASLAEPLEAPLGVLGSAAEPVALVLVTAALTFVSLVLGELVPKRLALQRAEGWSLRVARPLGWLAKASRPVVTLLGATTDLFVRLLGGDPSRSKEDVSEEEIRDLVASHDELSDEQRRIVDGVFEVADRRVREVLVPRPSVLAFEATAPAAEVLAGLVASGHSRAPVHGGDLDRVTGVVHLRDLVGQDGTAGDHARPALALPDSVGVLDALTRMRAEHQQLAVVVDEHGGSDGIVTVEDLVEELVGEIEDETDRDAAAAVTEPDGSIVVVGGFPVHDLPDLGVEGVPGGDYATVAGLVLDRLGHLPEPGEAVEVAGWRLEVVAVEGRAVGRVRLRPA